MDLRTRKTLSAIRNAFIQLRAHRPLEKISVKELTEMAMISKGTFYLHYRDIYDLSESLQKEIIEEMIASIRHKEDMLYNPSAFTLELVNAFRNMSGLTDILFSGDQDNVVPKAIESALRATLYQHYPALANLPEIDILITFEVQGAYHAYYTHRNSYSYEEVITAIDQVLTTVAPLHKQYISLIEGLS